MKINALPARHRVELGGTGTRDASAEVRRSSRKELLWLKYLTPTQPMGHFWHLLGLIHTSVKEVSQRKHAGRWRKTKTLEADWTKEPGAESAGLLFGKGFHQPFMWLAEPWASQYRSEPTLNSIFQPWCNFHKLKLDVKHKFGGKQP